MTRTKTGSGRDPDATINRGYSTNSQREHRIVTAAIDDEDGYVAWASDRPEIRSTGDTRWSAVRQLAAAEARGGGR